MRSCPTFLIFAAAFLGGCRGKAPAPQGSGGQIHGLVYTEIVDAAAHAKRRIVLPDVTVYVKNTSTNEQSPKAVTDARGRYVVPQMPAGNYVLCWEGDGYQPGCTPEKQKFPIQSGTAAPSALQLTLTQPAITGRVTLAGGNACVAEYPMFGLSLRTKITLVDAAGQAVHKPVFVNQRGEFIVPNAGAGSFHVQAECDGLKTEAPVGERGAFLKVAIQAARPVIRAVYAGSRERTVRHAPPGAIVPVSVSATQANNGRLHYRWFASDGSIVSKLQDAPTVQWSLAKSSGSQTMYVMVSGENGGHSIGQVSVSAGAPGALFSGTVTDTSGVALTGAAVSINGQSTTTNTVGYFLLQLPQDSTRYVLNITKDGYATWSRVLSGELVGATFSLVKSQSNTVDPTHAIDITQSFPRQNRAGAELQIPANSIVDSKGKIATGSLTIYLSTVDLHDPIGRLAGNFTGKSASNQRVRLSTYGALDVQIRDTAGNPFNLKPGTPANVRIPVDPAAKTPPANLPLWYYDQKTGFWGQDGSAVLAGQFYQAEVRHFSSISIAFASTDSACIALSVDPGTVGSVPFPLTITFTDSTLAAHTLMASVDPASPQATISGLPPNEPITLQVGNFELGLQNVNSGAAIPAADDPTDPPAGDCGGVAYLVVAPTNGIGTEPDSPGEGSAALSPGGFLDYYGLDTETSADAYYSAIDPTSAAGTGSVSSVETAPASLPASCTSPASGKVQAGSVPLVTGVGTTFTSFFVAGDMLQMGAAAARTISAVCDDTHLVTFSVLAPPGPPGIASTTYARIGAKTTLSRFLSANSWTTDQATATYLNANDLGFGRSMHMSPWTPGGSIAFFVSNFHNVETAREANSASIVNATATDLIATVAMEYSPTPPGTTPYTKFYVFNAKGARINNADLDQRGGKFVPRLCMICHGGAYVAPTTANQGNEGSRFIGFDLSSYGYSGFDPAFSRSGQEQAFRLLNQGVLEATNPSTAQQQLLAGWYGGGTGIDTAGTTQIDTYVPTIGGTSQSWNTAPTPAGATVVPKSLYGDTVRTSCRTCHADRDAPLDWNQFGGFNGFQSNGATIEAFVCEMRIMPQAKVTYINFWANSAPILPPTGPPTSISNPNRRNELMNSGLSFVTSTDPCPLQ